MRASKSHGADRGRLGAGEIRTVLVREPKSSFFLKLEGSLSPPMSSFYSTVCWQQAGQSVWFVLSASTKLKREIQEVNIRLAVLMFNMSHYSKIEY